MKFRIVMIAFMMLPGCAGLELHIKDKYGLAPPSLMLIDRFEIRDMNYDPHLSSEFAEAVAFELYKKGYNTRLVGADKIEYGADLPRRAADLCAKYGADMFIAGVISLRETGFLTDRKISTGITFYLYSQKGDLLGRGYFHDGDSDDKGKVIRMAALKFSSAVTSKLRRK